MRIIFCPKSRNLRYSQFKITSTTPWVWLMHKTLTHPECEFMKHTHTISPPKHNWNMSCCFGFPQKQTALQGFKCQKFTWEVIPGDAREAVRWGREDSNKGFVFQQGSVWVTDLILLENSGMSKSLYPGGKSAGYSYTPLASHWCRDQQGEGFIHSLGVKDVLLGQGNARAGLWKPGWCTPKW